MRVLNGIRMLGWAAILASLLSATGDVQAAPDRQAVLVLSWYHAAFAWTDPQVEGITSVLGESRLRPEIFLEYLDVLRLPAPYDERGFADHLARRYRAQRFDLVIATDDAAVSFLARHQPSLFAGTPVVFSDAAAFAATAVPPEIAITGVLERIDIPSTLQVAQQLRPTAAQIVVYANRADTGTGFDHARDASAHCRRTYRSASATISNSRRSSPAPLRCRRRTSSSSSPPPMTPRASDTVPRKSSHGCAPPRRRRCSTSRAIASAPA